MNFKDYLKADTFDETTSLKEWFATVMPILEATTSSRYSVEVNFRTRTKEVLEQYARIALGFVSAAMKQSGYHVRQVFEQSPVRIIVSSRNWDDGEWVGMVHFHPDHDGGTFIVSKGFYNRDRKTVSVQSSAAAEGDSAADISRQLRNMMHQLKNVPDRHIEKLRPIPMKRGPKRYGIR